jgi:hypothetical protein
MDLTLEIHGWVESLQDALTQFTSPEDLDGENMYKCGRYRDNEHICYHFLSDHSILKPLNFIAGVVLMSKQENN